MKLHFFYSVTFFGFLKCLASQKSNIQARIDDMNETKNKLDEHELIQMNYTVGQNHENWNFSVLTILEVCIGKENDVGLVLNVNLTSQMII